MSNKIKATEIKAVPFFARFLEAQATETGASGDEGTETLPPEEPPFIFTLKFPSDWEER
ncbi:MAG: microviridin/marinostatin family tricyclic proteinase inhibitor [Lyngbya sp.]|nr:microviridin/marinostatin family tricyclic proteinase inhibitor [Lyngbya sp.]